MTNKFNNTKFNVKLEANHFMNDTEIIINGTELIIATKISNYSDNIYFILSDLKGQEYLNDAISPCS